MSLLAGILGIALILLVLGLGWHTVWSGLTLGVQKAGHTISQAISYLLPSQQDSSPVYVPHGNGHWNGLSLNKA